MLLQDDYAKVTVPTLAVEVNETTTRQIFAYTLILISVTLLLTYPLQGASWLYPIVAIALDSIFVYKA